MIQERTGKNIQKVMVMGVSLSMSNTFILSEHLRSEYIVRGYLKAHSQIMPYRKLEIIHFGNTEGCPILIENGEVSSLQSCLLHITEK